VFGNSESVKPQCKASNVMEEEKPDEQNPLETEKFSDGREVSNAE